MRHLLRPLDRYVLQEFTKIFLATSVGFPILVIVIDLTDRLDRYLNRNLPKSQIALSYLYWIPDSMFMALPAAVLFATVFAIGGFTRHSEITAAKASGISFHRLVLPIFLASIVVAVFGLLLGELVPVANAKRNELLQERRFSRHSDMFNFVFASDRGRVYKISNLSVDRGTIDNLEIERKGSGPEYPTYIISVRQALWESEKGWRLMQGEMHILPDTVGALSIAFDSLRDRRFRERPAELTTNPRSPDEMRFGQLSRFIQALERSGADVNELKVELMLKIAVPITCIIIAIFGAPLATSTQRGGAAYGVAVSLATTVIFLTSIQLTKAVGEGGLLPPYFAAWVPNMLFGVIGVVLLSRART
ncbi:MAG TPA: LptF/LptG family permease [Gemmatimonadaceae bacterium]|nr:LptF/LptG family permease [Gemmatimonadaceae bacterium]